MAVMDLPMLEEYGGCKSWIELEPAMDFPLPSRCWRKQLSRSWLNFGRLCETDYPSLARRVGGIAEQMGVTLCAHRRGGGRTRSRSSGQGDLSP